jgi:hypothetical protein
VNGDPEDASGVAFVEKCVCHWSVLNVRLNPRIAAAAEKRKVEKFVAFTTLEPDRLSEQFWSRR